jgi:ankyrin repeat protein
MTPSSRLFAAVNLGDAAGVRAALGDGADVNAKDARGMTALHRAAMALDWNPEIVGLLAAAGADALASDPSGITPLHIIARIGGMPETTLH